MIDTIQSYSIPGANGLDRKSLALNLRFAGRPASQARIRTLLERGFHKLGDVETRLGYHVGLLGDR